MVRVVTLVLMYVASASAISYADYSGVKMPHYGGAADYDTGRDPAPSHPSDDYHGHSPDAPASLDYKYEEKPRVKTEKPLKDLEDLDVWRKSGRKQKESIKSDINVRHKFHDDEDDDEIPNFTTNRRHSKHRSRLKNEVDQIEEDVITPRRNKKYSRDRKNDISVIDRKEYLHIDKDVIPEDKNKEFDEDVKFIRDVTTKRSNRRRPREKEFKRIQTDDDYFDENWPEAPIKPERDPEKSMVTIAREEPPRRLRPPEQRVGPIRERERAGRERVREHEPERDRDRDRGRDRPRFNAALDEEEEVPVREEPNKAIPGKFKPKAYDEYDDYYDMKRVQNIKSKLPSLLMRRTTVRALFPTKTRHKTIFSLNKDIQEMMTAGIPFRTSPESEQTTDVIETMEPYTPTRMIISPEPTTTTTTTSTSTTTTVKRVSTTMTTTSKKSTIPRVVTFVPLYTNVVITDKPVVKNVSWSADARNLAILRKAERKEGLYFQSTKKPPVLIHVTKYVPTVVLVEPASVPDSMAQVRNNNESPERLLKIKRLMRRKLVANAKSIHDLTDNWDDMVCDYVDTSLLSTARALTPTMCLYYLQLHVLLLS